MKAAERFFQWLDKIVFGLTAFCMAGLLFCVFLQVVARMTALQVNWTTELSQYFFLWSTTFASYVAARRGKLIGVELLQQKMPAPVRRLMKAFSWGATCVFYALVIKYCAGNLPRLMTSRSAILKWPMGLIYLGMLLGLGMLALYAAYMVIFSLVDRPSQEPKKKTAAEIAEEVE